MIPFVEGDQEGEVTEGVLLNRASGRAYPVANGVPVMLPNAFTEGFLRRHADAIDANPALSGLGLRPSGQAEWAFDPQWEIHLEADADRTWGHTVPERIEQFFMETQSERGSLDGKLVMDAGCGNGLLTEAIADLGPSVVGFDHSSSVVGAEQRRRSDRVHYIQGDLQKPAFDEGTFDLIICIGVLMCTPDTLESFRSVARLVKPGGRFYAWVYRRPERFLGRHVKVPIYDFMRFVICRLPPKTQAWVVKNYARLVKATHDMRKPDNPIPLHEYVVSAYDDMTPMWRRYHTPLEMCRWFHECGFSSQTLTHWDNPYGFGMLGTKDPLDATPGIHYGDGVKLWDNDMSLLGRVHQD